MAVTEERHVSDLRDVYCELAGGPVCLRADASTFKVVGRGRQSVVYGVKGNDSIVIKRTPLTGPRNGRAFTWTKVHVWNSLTSLINSTAQPERRTLESAVCVPLFYRVTGGDHPCLVTVEPRVLGRDLKHYLPTIDYGTLAKVLFIVADVLQFLGDKVGFNHNDLHFGNIMLVRTKDAHPRTYEPLGGGLPSFGMPKYFPVIVDYDWSCVQDHPPGALDALQALRARIPSEHSPFAYTHRCVQSVMGQHSPAVDAETLVRALMMLIADMPPSEGKGVRAVTHDLLARLPERASADACGPQVTVGVLRSALATMLRDSKNSQGPHKQTGGGEHRSHHAHHVRTGTMLTATLVVTAAMSALAR